MRHVLAAILIAALWAVGSRADEQPCRADGKNVTCERSGFDVLVRSCLDAKTEAKTCGIKLDAVTRDYTDAKTALDACLAKPAPQPIEKPSSLWPVALASVGSAVLTAAASLADLPASGRATGAMVGLALVGAGIFLVLP